ncbi:MAG: NfeD family protein [Rikenellaceae bacterium]
MDGWIIWVTIALVAIFIELFTLGFAVVCFAFGALCAALVSYLGGGVMWQLGSFSLLSLVAMVTVRPLALRYFIAKSGGRVKTNVNALVGRVATVSSEFKGGEGRVVVDGDDWKARVENDTDEPFAVGERVEIVEVESVVLIIKKR